MIHTSSSLRLLLAMALTVGFFNTGCDKHNHTEGEVITRVTVHLTGIGNSFNQEFEAKDDDGDGTFNSIDPISLPAGSAFMCRLHLYDDTKTPVEDISEEVAAESNEHLFVYAVSNATMVIGNLNTDGNGAPFGLESIWTTALASTGSVKITLYHEPTNKNSTTDPGGEVDVEVSFPVTIQ
ncbi:MAG: hypothetical protein SFV22_12445 [Saprospiraceae bacterium]|nr:hypothetical protein [Saprospiraceae bacterium]